MEVVAIAGSLRQGSYNAALLRAAVELAPTGLALRVASIRDIPLYDADVEARAFPESVRLLKDQVASAQGLLLVTPEYNNSIPGVMKNAIDWLSRPSADTARVFGGKPVGLIGASSGRMGTISAQTAWLPVFRSLDLVPYFGKQLYISGAAKLFDTAGTLTDADTRERLKAYLAGFATFVAGRV